MTKTELTPSRFVKPARDTKTRYETRKNQMVESEYTKALKEIAISLDSAAENCKNKVKYTIPTYVSYEVGLATSQKISNYLMGLGYKVSTYSESKKLNRLESFFGDSTTTVFSLEISF